MYKTSSVAQLYKQAIISDLRYIIVVMNREETQLMFTVFASPCFFHTHPHPPPPPSNNDQGGVLVHFWMVFVVPQVKSVTMSEEMIEAILRNSVHTSLQNRSSVGYLLGLPVDMDSILINGALVRGGMFRSLFVAVVLIKQCALQLFSVQITHRTQKVGLRTPV